MNAKSEFKKRPLHLKNILAVQSSVLLCLAAVSSPAQTHTVTDCNEANLRAAMAGGGTVTFSCDGTITLAGTITNLANTVLDGSGHQVTISGGDTVRVFSVTTNLSFKVVNLTIAHGLGRQGGGILNLGGHVSLYAVEFLANTASYDAEPQAVGSAAGGGIFNQGGTIEATNCVFLGNQARQQTPSSVEPSRTRGGAVCNESGVFHLQSCSFYSNSAAGAAGPFNTRGTAHEASGGAIANSGTLDANLCTFVANSATGGVGGGIAGEGGAGNGGAVCNLGIVELNDCTFLTNNASGGLGGVGGNALPTSFPSRGGPGGSGGSANGGALFNAGVAKVANCSFTGNFGRGGRGGTGGMGSSFFGPPDQQTRGGDGGNGGAGGSACGAVCDINALCLLTNCAISANSAFKGVGGPGGPGGYGILSGSVGPAGPDGQAIGALRSVGAIVMNTSLTANAPGGNCSGTFTDGGQNASSDCSCSFTNQTVPSPGQSGLPPFYLLRNFTGQELSYVDAHPFGPLVSSSDGTFYGVTMGGAWPGAGAVFKVNSNGTDSSFKVLHGFGNDPTYGPGGALALYGDVLYGTTVRGGQSNQGTIFKINIDGSGYQVLHNFAGAGDGDMPEAGLVLSGSSLFGTTWFGGSSGCGTIFKIETNGSGYSIVKSFLSGTNGNPASELEVSGPTLYGTTTGSGYPGGSTVFKINTDGSGYAVLKYLETTSPRPIPWTRLVLSGSTLFGTTAFTCGDGKSGCGSIFKINTEGSGFSILKQFPGSDGPDRKAGLIFSGGKLYGTTAGDASMTNCGSLFMMNVDGSGYRSLKQFNGEDGAGPNGNLLLLGNTLYGTTENGGFYGAGVAFALSLSPPVIAALPPSRTVELGGTVDFAVKATGLPEPSCQWFFNSVTPVPGAVGLSLHLEAVQFSQSGAYTLVLTNGLNAITSAPVFLNVIVPVERRPVLGVKLMGEAGRTLNLEYTAAFSHAPIWASLDSVVLTNTWQFYFDLSTPIPPQRFYRAWEPAPVNVVPALGLHMVPALTLTGAIGSTVRVDYINQFGPIDAWVTINTITLTNTSQLYFDTSSIGQPPRLWRIVPAP